MSEKKVISGSDAVAQAVKLCKPKVLPMYPITPSTLIPEKLSEFIRDTIHEKYGLAEMVKGYGVLFEIGNQKELAQHIVALSIDSSYYQSVVRSCKLRAAEFDSAKMVAQHIQLYKEIYGSK